MEDKGDRALFTKAVLFLAAVAGIVSGGYALIEYGEKIGGVRYYYENQELKANLEKERKENVTLQRHFI